MKLYNSCQRFYLGITILLCGFLPNISAQENSGIEYYQANTSYWQYHGKPILLLGGSSEDNLFQIADLEKEIELIKSCGGNYVRNTLSSRDSGNVWPFKIDKKSGLYDLDKWNSEYWSRLENFFKLTNENSIIVQMELWATFDYYRDYWAVNPFNPKNNINYTFERTKIDTVVTTHPIFCDNDFFRSVPMMDNNMPVLYYQQKFIDKVLSHSLKYDNVLYCIDNETSVSATWGKFWAEYITKIAVENGKTIHVTEMWDPHNLDHISHRETFDHPETYSFVEISQNNHQKGEAHWINGLEQLRRLQSPELKRPINNVKTYGNDLGRHGHGSQNGKESFVRSIFFGSAASRFHRPNSGLGISEEAQNVIKSLRVATDSIDFFESKTGDLFMLDRAPNESYCRYTNEGDYLIFFTDGGNIELNAPSVKYELKWLEVKTASWFHESIIEPTKNIKLTAPGGGLWFALLKALE
ncbi:MAG: DUF6298 domain-containing protein [Melioribacteraceae bacterium]|nr:DUF6298 domain-containing protein [Melioribacteraceae bacterium]